MGRVQLGGANKVQARSVRHGGCAHVDVTECSCALPDPTRASPGWLEQPTKGAPRCLELNLSDRLLPQDGQSRSYGVVRCGVCVCGGGR